MRKSLYAIPFFIFLLLLGLAGMVISNGPNTDQRAGLRAMPEFSVEGLGSADIRGPAIVNFFASWCIPCEAEHPVLTELAQKTPVYGIAFMDKREKLDAFLQRLGNPYTAIGFDADGVAAATWGVAGVPTSFVIDAAGNIVHRHDAPLTPGDVDAILKLPEAE